MEREHITPQGVSVFHDKNESIHSFCLRLSSCLIPEPFEKGKWKHLRTLEID